MRFVALILGASLCAAPALAAPDAVLKGAISGADNGGYRDLPFKAPAGVKRLTVSFSHTGAEQKTVIDLGLFDNERFRGWSGGDKATFTLSATDATPSYLPGPICPGTWKLILGVPNIRKGVVSQYEAKIHFSHAGDRPAVSTFSDAPLRS